MPLPLTCSFARRILVSALLGTIGLQAGQDPHWVGLWSTSEQQEATSAALSGGQGVILRQVVRLSHDATSLRLHLSNEYGKSPLILRSLHVAIAAPKGTLRPGTDKIVLFSGSEAVSIPAGGTAVSDPLAFSAEANADLSATLAVDSISPQIAGHPGSRATSYVATTGLPGDVQLPAAMPVVHWYVLSAIDGDEPPETAALVCFGDSFTDGHGVETDQNTRWTDTLARRLQSDPATAHITVLNEGIGGNRLLRQGLGPAGLSRLARDVLDQAGVKWVIVQLGVNDLGTRLKSREKHEAFASVDDLVAGYKQVIAECHAHGIKVALSTLTPFANATWYSTPDVQADRLALNAWIRSAGCDAVVDFDEALKDPADPTRLRADYSSEDHLHPSAAGYRRMAEVVPEAFLTGAGAPR
jgi:lysophospholipase L1-like esterase